MSARHFEAASEALARLQKLNPRFPYVTGNLWYSKLRACDWRGLEQLKLQIEQGLRAERRVIMPFAYTEIADRVANERTGSARERASAHEAQRLSH